MNTQTPNTLRTLHLSRRVRRLGASALLIAGVGGYTLYQHSTSAAQATLTPPSQVDVTPEPTVTYQDGEYTGDSVAASRWGHVQVVAVVENGELTDIQFLDYPHSRSHSLRISRVALPYLVNESIQTQSAEVDVISGATPTSLAFIESLQSALDAAIQGPNPTLTLDGNTL